MLKIGKLLAIFILTLVSSGPLARANDIPLNAINVASTEDAEKLASELIANSDSTQTIILYINEEKIPENLLYVIRKITLAKLNLRIVKTSGTELIDSINDYNAAPDEFKMLLGFKSNENSGFKALLNDAKAFVRNLFISSNEPPQYSGAWKNLTTKTANGIKSTFGITRFKDLSLWIKVPVPQSELKANRSQALASAGIAATSMGGCYVVTQLASGASIDPSFIAPAMSLAAWVYYNIISFRSFNATMTQGKSLIRTQTGWSIIANGPFFWTTSFLRSMLTNGIIMASKSGLDAFSLDSLAVSANNSILSVVSRSEIDRWIANKALPQEGRWSDKKVARVNFAWNTAIGLVKNFNLVANDPNINAPAEIKIAANVLFGGIALLNVSLLAKPTAINTFKYLKENWGAVFATSLRQECQAGFLIKSTEGKRNE